MKQSRTITENALAADLKNLAGRAYYAAAGAEDTLRRYHSLSPELPPDCAVRLARLHQWMFVPSTLWPFNLNELLAQCLSVTEKGRRLPKRHALVIDLLPEPPGEAICAAVAQHEHHVQSGLYEDLVTSQAKFAQNELALRGNPELQAQWQAIKDTFDVHRHADHKGVIRRTMDSERNLRPNFNLRLSRRTEAFQAAFDAFCLRWNLYGMQHDQPLLLKLAVNVTPHSTMIVIPAYWSLDPKRDIRWNEIARLHRIRVPGRQGHALAEGRADRRRQAVLLRELDAQARNQKLRGRKKHEFLCRGLGWVPETDPKRLTRLRKEFPRA